MTHPTPTLQHTQHTRACPDVPDVAFVEAVVADGGGLLNLVDACSEILHAPLTGEVRRRLHRAATRCEAADLWVSGARTDRTLDRRLGSERVRKCEAFALAALRDALRIAS